MTAPATSTARRWLAGWDAQQLGHLPRREECRTVIIDAVCAEALVSPGLFVIRG